MKVRLKVCGMRDQQNIQGLLGLEPDFIGMIFYAGSPRYAAGRLKKDFLGDIPGSIKKVGVFVNENTEKILETAEEYQLDYIQMHGSESPGQCEEVKAAGLSLIKTWAVGEDVDFERLKDYAGAADYYLFDTRTVAYGGSGRTFDWRVLRNYDNEKPFFLSGGIGPGNVDQLGLLTDVNVFALDINSRFETSPGLKDLEKIKDFIEKLKALEILQNRL